MHAKVKTPDTPTQRQARAALQQLSEGSTTTEGLTLRLGDGSGEVVLPAAAVEPLKELLTLLAAGSSPAVIGQDVELTTNEAAELLNISRPTLLRRLEERRIPYHMEGSHRRLRLVDVLAYREERDLEAAAALRELVALEEELGLRS